MCGSRKGPVNICQQDRGGGERGATIRFSLTKTESQETEHHRGPAHIQSTPALWGPSRSWSNFGLPCEQTAQNPLIQGQPCSSLRTLDPDQTVSQIKLEQIYQRSMWRSDLKTSCGWEDLSTQELVHFHPTVQEARSSTAGLDPEPPRRSYLLDWLILPHQSIRATPPPTNTITQLHRS